MSHSVTAPAVSRRALMMAGATAAGVAALAASADAAHAEQAAPVDDATYNVIVVGSGLAGLSCGVRLLEDGVENVLIVTKTSMGQGCNSRVAGGQFLYPLDDSDESLQAMIDCFMAKSENKARTDLTELVCSNSRAANDWLISQGCEFTGEYQVQPYDVLAVTAAPGSFKGMPDLLDTLLARYQDMGGQELPDAKLLDLTFDERGSVNGVKVRTADGIQEIRAANVVLATGGYLANKAVMEACCGADGDEILVRGNKGLTGDGLLAVERAGGMRYATGGIEQSLHIAPVPPTLPALSSAACIMYSMVVNKNGERFVDESRGYVAIGKAAYEQPGQIHASIFDADAVANLEVVAEDVKKFDAFGVPAVQADTLEELAEAMEMNPEVFAATVEEFNAAIDGDATKGLTIDKTACALPIKTAPFYAFYPLVPGGTQCFGGIYTDADCQALEADDTPIEGLYGIGEVVGGFFAYDYIGGASLTRCVVTAMHVANLIAGK